VNVRQEVHQQEKQHSAEAAAPPAAPAEPAVPVNSAVPVKSAKSMISAVKSVESSAEFAAESAPANNLGLPASWWAGERRETLDAAATKVDDAAVPIKLWNDVLLEDMERETKFSQEEEQALDSLRRMVSCQWRYWVTRCFCRWLKCPECAFLESGKLFKEYPIDLPDKRRVHQETTAAPKWKGCERCGKNDQKYGSWVKDANLYHGRGGYSWKYKQRGKGEVLYDPDSFGGQGGGYVWRPGGLAAYKRWRKKYQQQGSSCVQATTCKGESNTCYLI